MTFTDVTTLGWVAIIVIALLITITIWRFRPSIKIGDKSVTFGKAIDEKIAKNRKKELADKNLQQYLQAEASKIDKKCIADMKRIIRNLDTQITPIFEAYIKCEFPAGLIYDIIKSELEQRVDDNSLREKFSITEKEGYKSDITSRIKFKYENMYIRIEKTTCGEKYPKWDTIEKAVSHLIENWIDECTDILCSRINEKLTLYGQSRDKFCLDEYCKSAIIHPLNKNHNYLKKLGKAI